MVKKKQKNGAKKQAHVKLKSRGKKNGVKRGIKIRKGRGANKKSKSSKVKKLIKLAKARKKRK